MGKIQLGISSLSMENRLYFAENAFIMLKQRLYASAERNHLPHTLFRNAFIVNNILFKYKVHRDTTDTSYIQYNTFERDTEISLRLV